jgi:hypothetical protein
MARDWASNKRQLFGLIAPTSALGSGGAGGPLPLIGRSAAGSGLGAAAAASLRLSPKVRREQWGSRAMARLCGRSPRRPGLSTVQTGLEEQTSKEAASLTRSCPRLRPQESAYVEVVRRMAVAAGNPAGSQGLDPVREFARACKVSQGPAPPRHQRTCGWQGAAQKVPPAAPADTITNATATAVADTAAAAAAPRRSTTSGRWARTPLRTWRPCGRCWRT